MSKALIRISALALAMGLAVPAAWTQALGLPRQEADDGALRAGGSQLVIPVPLPRMAPELALETFEQRTQRQAAELGSTTETMVVRAELPDTRQQGEFVLKRYFVAPKGIAFAAVRFVGDTFVKTNVIARLLQSEVDHVQKGEGGDMSLSSRNYKFSFQKTETRDGRTLHVFNVKPRKKRVGLFKGKAYINAYTGSLVRVEGTLAKSPSFFIKKVEFVQDYEDVGEFTFPARIRSNVKTRLVGLTVIDIEHRDYETRTVNEVQQQGTPSAAMPMQSSQ